MEIECYAAYHKNKEEIEKSSSGAIFIALSDYILNNDGIVVSAAYNYENHKLEHIICKDKRERDLCRGSKYFQSCINKDIYITIEKYLKNSKFVLYVGMPCQVATIKKYLECKKIDTANFYTCDILCHGVGSPQIWTNFINCIERNKMTRVSHISFKDKKNGWENPRCIAKDENEKEYSIRGYSWLYFSDAIMRPSCYSCKYTSIIREGDITIGDFWKVKKKYPEMYNARGTSFLIINTEKGKELFKYIKVDLKYEKCELNDGIQNCMKKNTYKSKFHDKIMNDFKNKSSNYFFKKWKAILLIDRIKGKVMK